MRVLCNSSTSFLARTGRSLVDSCRLRLRPAQPCAWFVQQLPSGRQRPQSSFVCGASIEPKAEDLVKRLSKDDVAIQYARSSGPGGQNVNKVNTKVDMRLSLDGISWMKEEIKDALRRKEKNKINKDGELVITSTRTRSQADNVEDALIKMQQMIDAAAISTVPREMDEQTKKKLKQQKKLANENRLQAKKVQAFKKSERRAKIDW